MGNIVPRAVAVLLGVVLLVSPAVAAPPDFSWLPPAPKLPPPEGQVIRVATVEALFQAARDVRPGGTIVVEDGHYLMPRYFELSTDRVTLRSASGDRTKVVLDGAESRHGELVGLRACSGVTIADLTIQNIRYNGFKLNSNTGVHRVTIRNCVIHNIWQRGVKGVRVPKDDPQVRPPRDCSIEHCLFFNDRPKRFEDDPTDTPDSFNGNYIGGIDVMYADRWTIRDNVFFGIQGRTGEARGAVFLWHDSVDCLVERNVIVDCDSGICLGNSHRGPGTEIHCRRSIVRNNFVTRCPENGILADYTEDCLIAHNTIHDPTSRLKRLIRLVHDNEGLAVVNNLLSGPPMRVETESPVRSEGNLTRDVTEWFVDVAQGDLHLKKNLPGEVGQAASIAQVPGDFDREPRRSLTDVGADQGR
jgi:hypothetical protein